MALCLLGSRSQEGVACDRAKAPLYFLAFCADCIGDVERYLVKNCTQGSISTTIVDTSTGVIESTAHCRCGSACIIITHAHAP